MWQNRVEALLYVDGEYNIFRDVQLNQVLTHWSKIGGNSIQVNCNHFKLFRDGYEVGFLTHTVLWESFGTDIAK